MDYNEIQYERVARYLDGETIDLTSKERQLLIELQDAQHLLGERLNVELPAASHQRAQRRMIAAMGQTTQRRRFVGAFGVGVGLAASAAIFLAMLSLFWKPALPPYPERQQAQLPAEVLIDAVESSQGGFDLEMDLLADQIQQEEAEVANMPEPMYVDAGIVDLEYRIGRFWDDNDSWELLMIQG